MHSSFVLVARDASDQQHTGRLHFSSTTTDSLGMFKKEKTFRGAKSEGGMGRTLQSPGRWLGSRDKWWCPMGSWTPMTSTPYSVVVTDLDRTALQATDS
jgi:hypothetical protein